MQNENPLIFLIDTLFNIYIAVLLLRFLLQQFGADYYNPIAQFIVKATQPVVGIARRLIPSYRKIDIATLIVVVVFIAIKISLLASLRGGDYSITSILIVSVYDLISLIFDIFIFAIFLQAILSWVNPDPHNPVSSILYSLTAPILNPVKKLLPAMGGLDISPIFALIGLMFLKRVVLYFFQLL